MGVNDIRPPSAAKLPSGKESREQIERHFGNGAGILALAERLRAKNGDAINHRLAGQVAKPSRDDTHLVTALHKPLGDGCRHASPAPAHRGVFVAEDEDFHGRNRL
jgi:hypothetical protein